jgi:hypothetical protein
MCFHKKSQLSLHFTNLSAGYMFVRLLASCNGPEFTEKQQICVYGTAQVMFSRPVPGLSCQLNAWVTMLTCQWLMGPCKVLPQSPSAHKSCSRTHFSTTFATPSTPWPNLQLWSTASQPDFKPALFQQVNDVEVDGGCVGKGQGVLVER